MFTAGCTANTTLDDLKPVAPIPAETVTGNYALLIAGARGKTTVVRFKEPSVGHEIVVTVPYGDALVSRLETDIKAYAGVKRVILDEITKPEIRSEDDGLILIRLNPPRTGGNVDGSFITSPSVTGYSPRRSSINFQLTGEVLVGDKYGRTMRRNISVEETGVSQNFLVGIVSLVPAATRAATETSITEFTRQVISGIVAMRRELAAQPGS